MKLPGALFTTTLTACAAPAMAHVGSEALDKHLFEHIVIGLVIAIPAGYGLVQLLKRSQ